MEEIGRLSGDAEARACTEMMATSDPWIFFGRTFEQCLDRVRNPMGARSGEPRYLDELRRGHMGLCLQQDMYAMLDLRWE